MQRSSVNATVEKREIVFVNSAGVKLTLTWGMEAPSLAAFSQGWTCPEVLLASLRSHSRGDDLEGFRRHVPQAKESVSRLSALKFS